MTTKSFGRKLIDRFATASATQKIAILLFLVVGVGYASSQYEKKKTNRLFSQISSELDLGQVEQAKALLDKVDSSTREQDRRFAVFDARIELALKAKDCTANGMRKFDEFSAANLDERVRGLGRTCSDFVPGLAGNIAAYQERARQQYEERKRKDLSAIKKGEKLAILAIKEFDRSDFLAAHPPQEKSRWALTSGGTNFSYSFADPENIGQSMGVELNSDPLFITNMSISFTGTSIGNPARLSPSREKFLKDLLESTYPDIDYDELLVQIRAQQAISYPGGGNTMPRTEVGNSSIAVGVVASSLLISIRR